MAQLTDLSDLIYENEPSLFIKAYIECLIEGYSLKFPVEKDIDNLELTWTTIIKKLENDIEDKFISTVAKRWLKLTEKLDSNISEKNLLLMYKQLTGKEYKPNVVDVKAGDSYYTRKMDPLKAPKETGVSESYYKQKEIENTVPLPLKELAKRKKDAFKKKDAELFLIYHLSVARHDETPQVPLSSLPENILTGWEEIIYNEYNRPLSETFGNDLSSKWYYYVNQKGIPNTLKGLKSILFSLIIDSNNIENTSVKQTPQNPQPSKSFFKRLFGK